MVSISPVAKTILIHVAGKVKRPDVYPLLMGSRVKKEKTTMWVNVAVWDQKKVEVIQSYGKKGTKVYIEGSLEIRDYEKDGVKKQATEVVLGPFNSEFQLIGSTKSEDAGSAKKQEATSYDLDEDMPF